MTSAAANPNEHGEHGSHYKDVASHYDEHIFYNVEGPLVQWQLDVAFKKLDLQPGLRLVDIGGGTGGFTHELAKRLVAAGDKTPLVTLVEPSPEMLAKAEQRKEPSLECVLGDGLSFCSSISKAGEKTGAAPAETQPAAAVDRVMLKEVVHHIPEAERDETFRRLYEALSPGGRIVIITRPTIVTHYPFPKFFLDYWAENQPTPESYEDILRKAGLEVAKAETESFPLRIKRDVWFRMLHQRFWSWLHQYSDDQINAGIKELEEKFQFPEGENDDFCFPEKMVFVIGTKPAESTSSCSIL